MRLVGKVALITGAGNGIGRAMALAFAEEGADIVVAEIESERAEAVASEVREIGRCALAMAVDVTKADQVQRMVDSALSELGHIDILINNAGIVRPAMLLKMTEEQWDAVIAVHLKGPFLCTKAVASQMMERRSGKIINITSAFGQMGTIGQVNYAAAKAGVIGFTKAVARELAKYNIQVNALGPSAITRLSRVLAEDPRFAERHLARIPLGRWGDPAEMGRACVFLASADSDYMTGQVLNVDGGQVM